MSETTPELGILEVNISNGFRCARTASSVTASSVVSRMKNLTEWCPEKRSDLGWKSVDASHGRVVLFLSEHANQQSYVLYHAIRNPHTSWVLGRLIARFNDNPPFDDVRTFIIGFMQTVDEDIENIRSPRIRYDRKRSLDWQPNLPISYRREPEVLCPVARPL